MDVDDRLAQISQAIQTNSMSAPVVTAREFLGWFGAQRRGYWIVQAIRSALARAKLVTVPDFESVYIDAPIVIVSAKPAGSLAPSNVDSPASATPESAIFDDPTYRLSKLAAANAKPISIAPNAALSAAVTLMLSNDFSQLPVMTNERDVKGIISWKSIGARLSLGKSGAEAKDFMDPHVEIGQDASLFEALPVIDENQYVLVRGKAREISGIITSSDLSLQFKQLTEPFLLLGEIENHVRTLLAGKFAQAELHAVADAWDITRDIRLVSDLTFGEYIRLMEAPERWAKVSLPVDRGIFCGQLDRVRSIRNDVMHFDPDGVPDEDLSFLRKFVGMLQELQRLGIG